MKKSRTRKEIKDWLKFYGPFILVALIIIGWAIFFHFISPAEIVEKIGIKNAYIVIFILAVVCGFSSITGTTFYVAVAALAKGGANPLILGIIGGIGLCISDSLFYFVLGKGNKIIDKHWGKISKFIKKWIRKMPNWVVYPFVYLYSAFAPIPNDIMLITLSVADTPFKKIALFLFAGDITSTIILAHLSDTIL